MQLVYFNDLHKNLGCNMGRTAKISIIPVTFTVLPVIFYALPPPAALFFSHSLPPPSSNCPARTDISIAQKTCVFRPVDISVAAKHGKLIYQSVYSLLGIPLPSAHCVRRRLRGSLRSKSEGFSFFLLSLYFRKKLCHNGCSIPAMQKPRPGSGKRGANHTE